MRRFYVALLLLALVALPTLAQERGGILDFLATDPEGRFTDFIIAAEASGLFADANAPLTVFAPTNDAFTAALQSLGTTREALLGDSETLAALIGYHIIEGEAASSADLQSRARLETMQGDTLALSVNDAGQITINDTAAIINPDLEAGDGVAHAVDQVLLPPALRPDTQDEQEAQNIAHVRFAHFSPDTPALDVYSNGESTAVRGLDYRSLSAWYAVPAGRYTFAVSPVRGSADQSLAVSRDLNLALGTWHTIVVVGLRDRGTLKLAPVLEDYSPIAEGNARATVFHAISELPAIDMTVNGNVIISNLAYPGARGNNDGAFVVELAADTYNAQIIMAGTAFRGAQQAAAAEATAEPTLGPWVVVDLRNTTLTPDTNYFLALVGTGGRPEAVIAPTEMSTLDSLIAPLTGESGAASAAETIAAALAANPELSVALAAVESVGLAQTLAGEGQYTIFAPTNAAFDAIFEELSVSQETLLSDTERLERILRFHIAEGELTQSRLGQLSEIPSLEGGALSLLVSSDGTLILNERATLVTADIRTGNGVLHVIDAVLLPE